MRLILWPAGRGLVAAGVIISIAKHTVDVTSTSKAGTDRGSGSESRRRDVCARRDRVEQANQQPINRPNSRRRISSP